MRIAVDVMGGDHAPEALVEGVLLARLQEDTQILLFGDEEKIRRAFDEAGKEVPGNTRIVHAPENIGMGEAGPMAIRKKRDASLCVVMGALAAGTVDAVVSAGNSGAIVATAKHFVGLIPGLRRSAMAAPIPTPRGKVLLLDVGAHPEAHGIHLAQSAALAHAYLKVTEGLDRTRVGLVNLGREPIKGTRVIQRAFALLSRSSLNFVGNIEPHRLFADQADAAVCDGFTGNVLLKMIEGLSDALLQLLDAQLDPGDIGARDKLRRTFGRFQRVHHYRNVGGAPLLGIQKPVIVAHGRSRGPAVANAIALASRLTHQKVFPRIAEELEKDGVLADLKHLNAMLMLDNLKAKWGFSPK